MPIALIVKADEPAPFFRPSRPPKAIWKRLTANIDQREHDAAG
jgi:hypothetical protein